MSVNELSAAPTLEADVGIGVWTEPCDEAFGRPPSEREGGGIGEGERDVDVPADTGEQLRQFPCVRATFASVSVPRGSRDVQWS